MRGRGWGGADGCFNARRVSMIGVTGRIIHTFNSETYGRLLAQYRPKPIETEAENEAAIALALELEHRSRTPEEDTLLALLATLIEKFEEAQYPIPVGNSRSMLHHLMDARDLEPSDLYNVLGSEELVKNILSGQRSIDPAQAQSLAQFFQVDVSLFL
jgi:HTH-type transcriptional regulator / antitoxin HigA